ncbi:hypothetical protein APHDU1_0938 [Anaplasma phagocytophilum]|uniref:Uncharacterized protein n=1 Tax=Anaplasma phagocytophilum (strain HZ) TaxID=212042 RepID=Q2GLE5_ANAPZ|nr:hypothetical protein APH_0183 [Anaplasma phagocytophilum str. HZ]KJV83241.1 hypothetical protein APHHGE2_0410 [Anaplasma phagocytophilum str. HGE2]KJV88162.1 hypothetical protein APHNYW_0138 [Anaplasma phagocytophilum str. ApNYW]KKA00396.1 hypothetical protein APHDU1_0938 [Anaplasma phagocytophilum]
MSYSPGKAGFVHLKPESFPVQSSRFLRFYVHEYKYQNIKLMMRAGDQ